MFSIKQSLNSIKNFDWAGLGWQYLFFWYFSGVTQSIILFTGTAGFVGTRAALMMSFLWLIPMLFFPKKAKLISAVIGLFLLPFALLSLGYLYIYHQEFSQSVLFIVFESNASESSEYISNYFSWGILFSLLAYTAIAYLLWKKVRPVYVSKPTALVVSAFLIYALFLSAFHTHMIVKHRSFDDAFERLQERMEPAVPWQVVVGYKSYRNQLGNMQDLLELNAKIPPLKNLKDSLAKEPSTLVLVIGESTNRGRMSLYGYNRPTTPNLDKMRDELYVFNNVVSPRPYTIEVLQQVLTFGDQKNPDGYLHTPSIMNMMQQAGYKSYWITNQQTMTKRNTMLTTFSKQTDQQYYLNNNRSQDARQYDSVVLKPLEEVLKQDAHRKFIVVHLLGTHMNYKYRFPESAAKFTDRTGVPDWVEDGNQLSFYNSYDNAVLFNDYVVSSIINTLKKNKINGVMAYFSDHGEEVFDIKGLNFKGRLETAPTPSMYTVPFIIWTSPTFTQKYGDLLKEAQTRPYGNSDFIYTWSDLAGLSFEGFDPSKSLINKDFKPHTRWIGDPYTKNGLFDFDEVLKKYPPTGAQQQ